MQIFTFKVWLFALVLLLCFVISTSHWWFMSQVYTSDDKIVCNNIPGLVNIQRQLCRENPDVMVATGKGARLGVEECQRRMKDQRWNCSTVPRENSVFGKILKKASRESAFVHSVTAAAVVHEVTQACSRNELTNCTCVAHQEERSQKDFDWGGCSDNIAYSLRFAELFVDSVEQERDPRAKMNLHNNLAGRRAVQNHMVLACMCHGISGSCEYKTCWKASAPFGVVGRYLREKYLTSVLVTVNQSSTELVVAKGKSSIKPALDDLVFLEESPDYCVRNSKTGSLGTVGRACETTTLENGNCAILCCERGFKTIQIEEEYRCACKFHWCCVVKCKICRTNVDKRVCN